MKPRFPLPEEVPRGHFKQVPQEQEPHAKSTQKALPWLKLLPAGNPLIEIFGQIHTAILYTKSKELRKAKWKCIEYILYWIDPIMHNLLSLETETDGKPSENLLFNMCRLGICIFLGPIRRNCGKLGLNQDLCEETEDPVIESAQCQCHKSSSSFHALAPIFWHVGESRTAG